jgi:hypothetical protein
MSFLNLGSGFVTPMPDLQAEESSLVDCPVMPIQYIRSYPSYPETV